MSANSRAPILSAMPKLSASRLRTVDLYQRQRVGSLLACLGFIALPFPLFCAPCVPLNAQDSHVHQVAKELTKTQLEIDICNADIRNVESKINEIETKLLGARLSDVEYLRDKEKQLRDKEKQLRDEKDKLRSKEELLMTARRDIVGDKRTVQVRQTFRASCRTRNVPHPSSPKVVPNYRSPRLFPLLVRRK